MTKLQLEINGTQKINESLTHENVKKRVVLLFSESRGSDGKAFRINYEILSSNVDLELLLLVVGKADNYYNFDVNVTHSVPGSRSKVVLRSVLSDRSLLNCKGRLLVEKGALGTDTFLRCDALMLSDMTKVKAIPSLEIIPGEVRASHNASIGGVDEENLFYLQTRGFNRDQASNVLANAFMLSSVSMLSDLSSEDISLLVDKVSSLASPA